MKFGLWQPANKDRCIFCGQEQFGEWRCGNCHKMQRVRLDEPQHWMLNSGNFWNGESTRVCGLCATVLTKLGRKGRTEPPNPPQELTEDEKKRWVSDVGCASIDQIGINGSYTASLRLTLPADIEVIPWGLRSRRFTIRAHSPKRLAEILRSALEKCAEATPLSETIKGETLPIHLIPYNGPE